MQQSTAQNRSEKHSEKLPEIEPLVALTRTAVKSCCVCGVDVTHRDRFKDHQGKYFCPGCKGSMKRPRRRLVPRLVKKLARWTMMAIFYVSLAIVGAGAFYVVLGKMASGSGGQ